MAPMIDMVFLLLVFFMTVSTMAQSERLREVELPESHESEVPDDLSGRRVVSIDADGALYLGTQSVTLAELKHEIRRALREHPRLRINLRADQATTYGDIRQVLQALSELGAHEVIYATHQAT